MEAYINESIAIHFVLLYTEAEIKADPNLKTRTVTNVK